WLMKNRKTLHLNFAQATNFLKIQQSKNPLI
ncbi:MAG: hypothetical protein ACI83B_000724, partial [Sediminicola sp.]